MKKTILFPCAVMPNKLLLALVIALAAAGMAWAADGKFGEINLKAGYQFEGLARDNITEWFNYDINNFYQTDPGFAFGAEYVYPLFNQTLKIGAGAQYELPREAWDSWSGAAADLENERVKYSLLPIYATIQYHPIRTFQELFIKGNIGYNLLTSIELLPDGVKPGLAEKKGGVYWQVSAGFEADWGLWLECFYSQKYFSAKWDFSDVTAGMPTSNDLYKAKDLGFSIGYKIKL
ncbi:MAG: hypothetical protein LBK44_07440 [Spirochaetales bacterium]|nr:hypothetical protein [Spirochaetales bacterium]